MKIIGLQAPLVWENPKANQAYFIEQIKAISSADLIALPEMFATGFSMQPKGKAQSITEVDYYLAPFKTLAKEKNCTIVGSLMVEDNGDYYNRLYVLQSNGKVDTYNKKHLFTFAGEHKEYQPGKQQLQLNIKGVEVAFFICYDLRFPVWIRNKAEKPYDLAVFVANWPKVRINAWQTLLKARAIENQCFVFGLNRIGTDGNNIEYNGASAFVDPYGHSNEAEENKAVAFEAYLDLALLKGFREKFPVLNDADGFTLH